MRLQYTTHLRIHHPSADPDEVARALGWTPKWVWTAGERRRDGAGRPLEGYRKSSYATFQLGAARSVPLPVLMKRVLHHLERQRAVLRDWVASGGRMELWLSLYVSGPGGEDLEAAIVRRCSDLDLGLSLLVTPGAAPLDDGEHRNVLKALRPRAKRTRA